MSHYSFFHLTHDPITPDDALPGISASEEDFLALVEAMHEAINTFHHSHEDLTYGDAIHAAKCLVDNLVSSYVEHDCDA